MRSPQRVYLYTITWVSATSLLTSLTRLTGLLLAALWGLAVDREAIALWSGAAAASLPIFLGHHVWLQRRLRASPEEQHSEGLQLFLQAVRIVALMYVARGAFAVLYRPLRVLVGFPVEEASSWWSNWLTYWGYIAWGGLFLVYASHLGRYVPSPLPAKATRWSRLFTLLVGEAGVGLGLVATTGVLATGLMLLVPPVAGGGATLGAWWREPLALYIPLAWMGIAFWAWAWYRFAAPQTLSEPGKHEHPLTQQAFYYLNIGIGVGAALLAAAYVVRWGLLRLFGEPLGPRHQWWPGLALALAALLPAGALWWVHRRQVWQVFGSPQTYWYHLAVGRLYTYVMSAAGLVVAGWGAATLLRTGLTLVLPPPELVVQPAWWRKPLATGVAALLVAGPVWLWHWRRVQEVARATDAWGARERRSRLRRTYLYGVSLGAGLLALVYLGRMAYGVWLWLLNVQPTRFVEELANGGGPALVAVIAWIYHLAVLRRDTTLLAAPSTVQERREQLEAERERLRRRLAEIEEELAALDAGAQEAGS